MKKEYFLQNLLFVVMIITQVVACTNDDAKPGTRKDPGIMYFDYKIWGDEERNTMTITLQYREGGVDGDPVSLVPPAKVELDGEELVPDSSVMNGVYYEAIRTVSNFEGDHRIVYTDPDGKSYIEEFSFSAMRLNTNLPGKLPGKELAFELDGLDTSELIHVIMTDTSRYGRGIDKVDTVRDGYLKITQDELKNLKNGPVFLEFYREVNRPLKETANGGGRLIISYSLKRAFELDRPVE